jgi:SAM-dependent methyltransferase
VTSLDRNWTNLERAPQPKLLGDAFALPFGPDSFDFVLSSLFLHHFPDEQIVELLRSFHVIARRAVLVSDLERHILPWLFLRTSKRIFGWNHVTVHDGLISVKAALRKSELRQLALRAGIEAPQVLAHRPAFRLSLIGKKADSPGAQ